MDYNDIIVIIMLTIIIIALGLLLSQKEYSHFTQIEKINPNSQNNLSVTKLPVNNFLPINLEHQKYVNNVNNVNNCNDNDNYNFNNKNVLYKNIENINNSNQDINNNKFTNNKNNKKLAMLKNTNVKNNISINDNINNNYKNVKNVDLNFADNNSLITINKLSNNMNEKKIKYKNNEQIKRKVIIDDYSELDNIKSLNSMDNTLSDLISIIQKDK